MVLTGEILENGIVNKMPEGLSFTHAAVSELCNSVLATHEKAGTLAGDTVAMGKGKNNPLDRHAKPTDEEWVSEAARRGLSPNMLIEFVDSSKTMIEMAAVSNATGLVPDVRGMHTMNTLTKLLWLKKHEAACPGAAILASVGAGHYRSVDSAVHEAVGIDRTITPHGKNAEAYEGRYACYLELYPKLISFLRRC
ncbi:MAG TPA: hypothetical protein VMW24_21085 [Sedimentisphaerales bacterium]|nr:hypothetical protein [Sedimentisphaerales bacterium]